MLTTISVRGYSPFAAFNSAVGFGDPDLQGRQAAECFHIRGFFVGIVQRVVMAGWTGRLARVCRYLVAGSPTSFSPATQRLATLGGGFKPIQGVPTMHTNALNTSRKDAHRINPLISDINKADSLEMMAAIVRDMGYMLSQANDEDAKSPVTFGNMYLFCNVLAAALEFESDQVEVAK